MLEEEKAKKKLKTLQEFIMLHSCKANQAPKNYI